VPDDPRPHGPTLIDVPVGAVAAPPGSSPALRPLASVYDRVAVPPMVDGCVAQARGAAGPDDDARSGAVPVPSWEEIAERYGDTVFTMAYRLTGDRDEARDLAQDVFVRVYRNLDRYRPGTFEGWLYRITKNLFLDRVRRRARVRMEPLPDEEWRQPPESGPGPAEAAEAGVLRGDLELALQDLTPSFRTAVVLCDVQGLSYEEIAIATGWPIGTVRSRIHRGRRLLRGSLEDQPGG
jgi:RNA polymerase sigma-70 factor, ECF subfamily